jgi:hypothetical protein
VAFLAVSALVICMPGPDTALTVRNALAAGRRGGIYTAAGVATGQLVWTIAVSVGIAGVLAASAPAFLALKLIGAAYLIYLGVQSLRAAWNRGVDTPAGESPRLRVTPARAAAEPPADSPHARCSDRRGADRVRDATRARAALTSARYCRTISTRSLSTSPARPWTWYVPGSTRGSSGQPSAAATRRHTTDVV